MSKSESTVFVKSVDSLFGQVIPSEDCPWFSERPPLVLGAKDAKRSLKQLKQKCRLGLPAQLRCAVWIASVERIVNPQLPIAETDAFGTEATKRNIDAKWDYALNAVFPNLSDRKEAIPPDLGLQQEALTRLIQHDYKEWNMTTASAQSTAIPEKGANSLALILCIVQQVLGIEYCPPLPDVATILLSHMPKSYVFATIREMINDTSQFLPVCQKDYFSWCQTFSFFVRRLFPAIHKAMDECGALQPKGLAPIFQRFFTTLLKRQDVLRFMDIFLVEGCKAIFRVAFALLQLVSIDLKILTDSESWWNEIRHHTLDPAFSFEKQLLENMYPKIHRKFGKRAKRYPQRKLLRRVMKNNEKWALENMPIFVDQTPPKPMGFTSNKTCALVKPASLRANLANWLPPSLKSTKLDLVYSTEIHGRSLTSLYKECHRSKNTIILIEALTTGRGATIGMFASHAWNVNPSSYGSGECFLFRANPNPKCFNWEPGCSGGIDAMEDQAAREQFMVAKGEFMAMGANSEGTNGLRLDQDLIKGESYNALGFNNEPLPGCTSFDIGFLEVYQLIREVGGKAIGHDDNLVWDMEGL